MGIISNFFPTNDNRDIKNSSLNKMNIKEYNYNSFHKEKISLLYILKDGRLASSSEDQKLNIYNENIKSIDLSIKHKYPISSFLQLYDEKIIICSSKNSNMTIIKLKNKNQYEIIQEINMGDMGVQVDFKIRESKDNELIAIYNGRIIRNQITIWKLNKNNKYELIMHIKADLGGRLFGILKLNEKEFVVLQNERIMTTHPFIHREQLVFRSLKNYKIIKVINNLEINHNDRYFKFFENMYLISKDIFSVWEKYGIIKLIKISTHEIIKQINISIGDAFKIIFYSFNKFSEDKMIVFASLAVKKREDPPNRRNPDTHYSYKNYIFLHKINENGIKEILKYEYDDNEKICKIGTKYKNNFIATCQDNNLKLIEINDKYTS